MKTTSHYLFMGIRHSTPFMLVITPFSLLFGAVATDIGLNLLEVIAFSMAVVAGAAQFTAVQLISEEAPTIIVLASSLAVNLRFAMYSASLAPHLGAAPIWKRAFVSYFLVDQAFALSAPKFEAETSWGLHEKLPYFFGSTIIVVFLWFAGTAVGALIGESIPPEYALDFAVPICFLAMIGPALRTPAHIGAALTAIIASTSLAWVPHSLGILIAGLIAMIVGAEIERRMTKGAQA